MGFPDHHEWRNRSSSGSKLSQHTDRQFRFRITIFEWLGRFQFVDYSKLWN